MNRDEFVRMLDTEPATRNQIGAVRAEFRRLGLDGDRPGRLAAVAAIVGLDSLSSVKDLSMGQAGHLVKTLRSLADAGQLAAACHAPAGAQGTSALAELAAVCAAWQ